jgi:hypothetical protein
MELNLKYKIGFKIMKLDLKYQVGFKISSWI